MSTFNQIKFNGKVVLLSLLKGHPVRARFAFRGLIRALTYTGSGDDSRLYWPAMALNAAAWAALLVAMGGAR